MSRTTRRVARLMALALLSMLGLIAVAPVASATAHYPYVPPRITVDKGRVQVGDVVTVTVTGMKPGTTVTFSVGPNGNSTACTPSPTTIKPDGTASCTFTASKVGRNQVVATGTAYLGYQVTLRTRVKVVKKNLFGALQSWGSARPFAYGSAAALGVGLVALAGTAAYRRRRETDEAIARLEAEANAERDALAG